MRQGSFESYNTATENAQEFSHRDNTAPGNLDEYRMGAPLKGMIAQNDFASPRPLPLRKESDNTGSSDYAYAVGRQPLRHAYETSQMYAQHLNYESHSNSASSADQSEKERHVWTASFKAADTTCDVTLPQVAITNMPENSKTMPRIQEIPDLDGSSHGYHAVMFNLSKHDGKVDFNVLGLSHQHAYSASQAWEQANCPVRLEESTRANHAALSQTRYAYGTATASDVRELNKRQTVQIERSFLGR